MADLMPVSTEAPRCSEFARANDLLPPGTGLFLDRVVLVTVPLPWPKPALKHGSIEHAARSVAGSAVRSRLFLAEPFGSSADTIVEVYERSGAGLRLHRWQAATPEVAQAVVAAVAATPPSGLDEVQIDDAEAIAFEERPTFLVCTQDSHDRCCGVDGVALAEAIERRRPDYRVRRVSHTGGHRFAPTLVAFPEGRMWAFADLSLIDRIASGAPTSEDLRTHSRGWWGAAVGAEQVAETAVRAELAPAAFIAPTIERRSGDSCSGGIEPVAETAEGDTFEVRVGDRAWQVVVRVTRQVPSIACEAPGGLPAKPGREFAWTIEEM